MATKEKGFGERPLRNLWLPVAIAAIWVSVGGLGLLSGGARHSVGLALFATGIIITVLAALPVLTGGVMRVMLITGAGIGGEGGLLMSTTMNGTLSLGQDIVVVVVSAAVVTAFVLLCWLAVEVIARRLKRR